MENVISMLDFREKRELSHNEEFTAYLGEIEFDVMAHKVTEFEVRGLRAKNSTRVWIVMEDEYTALACHNRNCCFLPTTPEQEIKQWVMDTIQREIGNCNITLV